MKLFHDQSSPTRNKLFMSIAAACTLPISVANAATLDLANVPIGAGGVEKALVMFVADDSGSMTWETLIGLDNLTYRAALAGAGVTEYSDYAEETFAESEGAFFGWPGENDAESYLALYKDWRIISHQFNRLYFNPNFAYEDDTYLYSAGIDTATVLANIPEPQRFFAIADDDEVGANGTVPLNADHNIYRINTSNFTKFRRAGSGFDPNGGTLFDLPHYSFGGSQVIPVSFGGESYSITANSTSTVSNPLDIEGDLLRQRFAIWYTEYRTREMVAKRNVQRALSLNKSDFIYGLQFVNNSGSIPLKDTDDFNNKAELEAHNTGVANKYLETDAIDGKTPLRKALKKAGEEVRGHFDSSCQKGFSLVFTDGFWNSDKAGLDDYGGGDPDGDGDGYGIKGDPTLADIAYYYYHNDLGGRNNNVTPSLNNPQTQQHMSTYAIGFGVEGTMKKTNPNSFFPDGFNPESRTLSPLAGYNTPWANPFATDEAVAGKARVDDLWKATWNSHGFYLSAASPQELAYRFETIFEYMQIETQAFNDEWILSGMDVGAANAANDRYRLYTSFFNPAYWAGDIKAYNVRQSDGQLTEDGAFSTRLTAEFESPPNSGITFKTAFRASNADCSTAGGSSVGADCYVDFNVSVSGVPTSFISKSAILEEEVTRAYARSQLSFDLLNSNLSTIQGTANPDTSQVTGYTGYAKALIDYLKGDRSKEGTLFRTRETTLGDVVNSSPVYVGKPVKFYPDNWPPINPDPNNFEDAPENKAGAQKYSAYVKANDLDNSDGNSRTEMLYFGANDGFLHGINALTGDRTFAFMPEFAYKGISKLSEYPYLHRFFNDGGITVGDAFDPDDGNGKWKTVMIAGGGTGTQGVYALDITDPGNIDLLWTMDDRDDANLGNVNSAPLIARFADGRWKAVFGSGFNNDAADGNVGDGEGHVFIVDIFDKSERVAVKLPARNLAPTNAVAKPSPVDVNSDNITDFIYVGDYYGRLFRIDVRDPDSGEWDKNGNQHLVFETDSSPSVDQPILTRPEVVAHPLHRPDPLDASANDDNLHLKVYFGTGQLLTLDDADAGNVAPTQAFYAVYDHIGANQEVELSDLTAKSIPSGGAGSTTVEFSREVVSYTPGGACGAHLMTGSYGANDCYGWYLELPANERVVVDPVFFNDAILFPSAAPAPAANQCKGEFTGWLMYLDSETGNNAFSYEDNGSEEQAAGTPTSIGTAAFGDLRPKGDLDDNSVMIVHANDDDGVVDELPNNLNSLNQLFQRYSWRHMDDAKGAIENGNNTGNCGGGQGAAGGCGGNNSGGSGGSGGTSD